MKQRCVQVGESESQTTRSKMFHTALGGLEKCLGGLGFWTALVGLDDYDVDPQASPNTNHDPNQSLDPKTNAALTTVTMPITMVGNGWLVS